MGGDGYDDQGTDVVRCRTGTGVVKYWGTMTQLIISCQQSLTSLLLVMTVAGDSSGQSLCDIETKASSANIATMGKYDPWISSEEYNVVIGWVSGYLTLGWLGLFACLFYIWYLFKKEADLRDELKKVKASEKRLAALSDRLLKAEHSDAKSMLTQCNISVNKFITTIGVKQEHMNRLTFDVVIPLTMHSNSLQEKRRDMVKEISERENQ